MTTIFLTGFPGFLGSALIEHLLSRRDTNVSITCLVQPKFRAQAEARASELAQAGTSREGRIRLIAGDITHPGLALSNDLASLQREIVAIYHLAAVYDLGVSRELGTRVNVDGTRHMLDFAAACPSLERFHYVSTCYVSGRYDGLFTEADLIKGQTFNNHYEETKYLAEVAVQQRMQQGLPTTIYRPSIVVGDSTTGATQKYDGPYYLIRWILRSPSVALVPVPRHPTRYQFNVVPRNFVVAAITHLSGLTESAGQVYHLADPQPPTIADLLQLVERATRKRLLRVPFSLNLLSAALERLPPLERWMEIEPQAFPYFSHPTRYASENTRRDLAGSGIACPPLASYIDQLVAYIRQHPNVPSSPMV
jgi:thioester reductase-like protein